MKLWEKTMTDCFETANMLVREHAPAGYHEKNKIRCLDTIQGSLWQTGLLYLDDGNVGHKAILHRCDGNIVVEDSYVAHRHYEIRSYKEDHFWTNMNMLVHIEQCAQAYRLLFRPPIKTQFSQMKQIWFVSLR